MTSFDTLLDARRVAHEVVTGEMDPHLGCGLIATIGEKLGHQPELMEFIHLAHLFQEPGHDGFTKESLLPDIMAACCDLAAL